MATAMSASLACVSWWEASGTPNCCAMMLGITATHNANTASHHTEWLKVTANKKEVARWDYTKENRPEGAVFTKEIKIKVTENTEIVAEASCNNHGSKGPAKHKIMVK